MATTAETKTKTKKKTFKVHDLIECRSITNGKYFLQGKKSNIVYGWLNNSDIEYVEYQDLLFEVNAKKSSVYKPRIIVLDEDFLSQNPRLQELYNSMYTTSDFEQILNLPENQMREVISSLPDGAIDGLKGIISTKIADGTLDSVRKIKILDDIFNTSMLLMLASN